jgi:SAM-dependent methyltransferase
MQATTPNPRHADPSRPSPHADYEAIKRFYRDPTVAQAYDERRFGGRFRRGRDARKWRAVRRALNITGDVRTTLDVPCGTGRFTRRLAHLGYEVVAADVSEEMMDVARRSLGTAAGRAAFVQADAEILPFRDRALDCVISIRFLFHADGATRVRILREMGRVSRRWLIVDYRHRYSLRYAAWRIKRLRGLTDVPLERVTRAEMRAELREAGLVVRKVIPVTRVFSDKWIVVGEAGHAS